MRKLNSRPCLDFCSQIPRLGEGFPSCSHFAGRGWEELANSGVSYVRGNLKRKGGNKSSRLNRAWWKDAGKGNDVIHFVGFEDRELKMYTSNSISCSAHPHPAGGSGGGTRGCRQGKAPTLQAWEWEWSLPAHPGSWSSSFSRTWTPKCFPPRWCNRAGSPRASNYDVFVDGKTLSCKRRTCLGKKGVAGFYSGFLENCFLPKNGLVKELNSFHKKEFFFSLLCPAHLYNYAGTDYMLTLSFKTLFPRVSLICSWNVPPISSPHPHHPPSILFDHYVLSTLLPLRTSWLVKLQPYLFPHSKALHGSLLLWGGVGTKNHRNKRQKWKGLKSFN